MRNHYQTRTRQGQTCHVGLTNKRKAFRLARQWSREFPDCAPYVVVQNGKVISK